MNVENSEDLCTFISPVQSPTRTVLKMIAQFALERLYFKAAKKVSILLKDYDGAYANCRNIRKPIKRKGMPR